MHMYTCSSVDVLPPVHYTPCFSAKCSQLISFVGLSLFRNTMAIVNIVDCVPLVHHV